MPSLPLLPCTRLALPLFLVPALARIAISQSSQQSVRTFTATSTSSNVSGYNNWMQIPHKWPIKKERQPDQLPSPDKKKLTFSMKARMRRRKRNLALRAQNRDRNKKRGISVIHSTGPRQKTSVYKYPLPVPVIDPEKRAQFKSSETHGLWGFFNEAKQAMVSGEEEAAFGRGWTYHELLVKDFDTLHKLYWTTILEINRTHTRQGEMKRLQAGYGDFEAKQRVAACWETNKNIKRVLADRHSNYVEATQLIQRGRAAEIFVEDENNTQATQQEHFMNEDRARNDADAAAVAARLRARR